MNSERFEAFIDAIIAIIITILVLELPVNNPASWGALWDLRIDFLAYFISFLVCFVFWSYNQRLFDIINKVNQNVIWVMAISLFVLSFLPYFTSMLCSNFNMLFPQVCYGLIYVIIVVLNMIIKYLLLDVDRGNIALQLESGSTDEKIILLIVLCGFVIGYFEWPQAIILACFLSMFVSFMNRHFLKFY